MLLMSRHMTLDLIPSTGISPTGGGEGNRTLDLYIANVALCQLSYTPVEGRVYPRRKALLARCDVAGLVPPTVVSPAIIRQVVPCASGVELVVVAVAVVMPIVTDHSSSDMPID